MQAEGKGPIESSAKTKSFQITKKKKETKKSSPIFMES